MSYLENYISSAHNEVEGWFGGDAITFFTHSDELQKELGITGSVAEIGIHHGRLFLLLLLLKRAEEAGVAIDVFDLQHLNYDVSGQGSKHKFLDNVRTYAPETTNLVLIEGDSLQITGADILKKTGGQRVRMFSIDGSHTAHATASDLALAQSVIAPGGIIAVDDYHNGGWPMVAEGVARFMLLSPFVNIAPIISGANKVLFTTKSHHAKYIDHFMNFKSNTNATLTIREFYNYPCVVY